MRDRLLLALWGAVIGFAVHGLATAALGAVLGALTVTRRELPAIVAVSALTSVALFAAFEQSLDLASFGDFVDSRPMANTAARIGVLGVLVAVADGWRRVRLAGQGATDDADDSAPLVAPAPAGDPVRPATAITVGVVVALAVLAVVGDHSWRWAVVPLAVTAVVVGLAMRLPSMLRASSSGVAGMAQGQAAAWSTRLRGSTVISGSVWMLGAAIAVSLGSFVFWLAAARLSDQSAVGAAAALFSVVTFLNYASALGLPVALSRYGRGGDDIGSAVLFTWCLLVTVLTSLIGVGVFAMVAPGAVHSTLIESPGAGWALLLANTIGMSVSVLVDVRYMTLGMWRWVFWRSVTISVVRLPFLFFVEDAGPLYLFLLISGAYTVTGLVWLAGLVVQRRSPLIVRPLPPETIEAARYAIVNHVGQLALQAPFFAIPVIVLTTQSTEDNASFYVAWGILSVVVVSVQVIGQVLLVEGRGSGRRQASAALAVGLLVTVSALVVVTVFGGLIRTLYGPGYEEVSDLLILLVAGTVPYTLTVIELSVARVRGDTRATMLITSLFSVLTLVPALVFTNGNGSQGAAWAWLLGNLVAAGAILAFGRLVWGDEDDSNHDEETRDLGDEMAAEGIDRREPVAVEGEVPGEHG